MHPILRRSLLLTALLLLATPTHAAILRVDGDVATPGDGSSWNRAFGSLQQVLAFADADDEVWVAAGTYTPTTTDDPDASFVLRTGVEVYGGFAATESLRTQRDLAANPTVLSGDLGGLGDGADNSRTVVVIENADSTTVLDGFVVTGGAGLGTRGTASGVFDGVRGGGIRVQNAQPRLANLRLVANGSRDVGMWGGGLAAIGPEAAPRLVNVVVTECTAERGGGLYANRALTATNVTLYGNVAGEPQLGEDGGGGAFFAPGADVALANTLVWANTVVGSVVAGPSPWVLDSGTVEVTHSLVETSGGSGDDWNPDLGTDLGNNLDLDPRLVHPPSGDLRPFPDSPAVDAGDSTRVPDGLDGDVVGRTRVCGATVDIGAYESQGIDCGPFDGIWRVATTGTDSSAGLPDEPFASLARAVEVAAPGDTISIADGLYEGPSNRDVDLQGKTLVIRSASRDATAVVFDLDGANGVFFESTSPDSTAGPVLEALTFRNGDRAVEVRGIPPFVEPADPTSATITSCRFESNAVGVEGFWSTLALRSSVFVGNTTAGVRADAAGVDDQDGVYRGNATGIRSVEFAFESWERLQVANADVVANDTGISLVSAGSTSLIASCRVDSNTTRGLALSADSSDTVRVRDTELRGNATGVVTETFVRLVVEDSRILDGTGDGLQAGASVPFRLERTAIARNQGWGVTTGTGGLPRTGNHKRTTIDDGDDATRVLDCEIVDNAAGGLKTASPLVLVRDTVVARNGGRGLEAVPTSQPSSLDVVRATFVANAAAAVFADHDSVTVANTIVVTNTGAAYESSVGTVPVVTCSNVFDNGSDYTGPLDGLLGESGNISVDPIFCDPNGGSYTLVSISPCLPDSPTGDPACGRIGARGQGCAAEPIIAAVEDIPADQGGRVRVTWSASAFDTLGFDVTVTGYGVYRRQDPLTKTAPEGRPKLLGWDFVATVPARGDQGYQLVADTLCDSTIVDGDCWSAFFVSAMTDDPFVFFDSPVDSGYSTDDLSPEAPGQLVVSYTGDGNQLSWNPSTSTDLGGYVVFRTDDAAAVPDPGAAPLVTTVLPAFADTDFGGASPWAYRYWVAATDFAGNLSALVLPVTTTDTPAAPIGAVDLRPNVPNPFNPATTLHFSTVRTGRVRLTIYDSAGRRVRTLVDGRLEAGHHERRWDGSDDTGTPVASGVYRARLQANGRTLSRSMLLLE